MKLFLFAIALSITGNSCKEKQKVKAPKQPLEERLKDRASDQLYDKEEKIFLLSTIYKISPDTISLIIKDYYTYNGDNYLTRRDSSGKYNFNAALAGISEKYLITKRKAASLIYSFIYEMQTKDDVLTEYQEMEEIDNRLNDR